MPFDEMQNTKKKLTKASPTLNEARRPAGRPLEPLGHSYAGMVHRQSAGGMSLDRPACR